MMVIVAPLASRLPAGQTSSEIQECRLKWFAFETVNSCKVCAHIAFVINTQRFVLLPFKQNSCKAVNNGTTSHYK